MTKISKQQTYHMNKKEAILATMLVGTLMFSTLLFIGTIYAAIGVYGAFALATVLTVLIGYMNDAYACFGWKVE